MAKSITVNKNGFTPIANGENKVHTIYSWFASVFVKIGKQSTSFDFLKCNFKYGNGKIKWDCCSNFK